MSRVVVVGGGVAGLAATWTLRKRGVEVILLERTDRVGGLVETEREGDWVLEHGADGFLSGKADMLGRLDRLGLADELLRGGDAPRTAFVAGARGFEPLPSSLFRFERRAILELLRSRLLSFPAKLRLLLEPLIPRSSGDLSVARFVARRLGSEVADRIIEPMLRGVYGAPAAELGVLGAMPKLAQLERRYGSLGAALFLAPRNQTLGGLVTLRGGMESVPRALARDVAASLRLGVDASAIHLERDGRVRVQSATDGALEADGLVLACPAHVSARLLAPHDADLGAELAGIRSSDVDVVSLGYAPAAISTPLDGTGFLVDPALGRSLVACTWSSRKWSGRAPESHVLLRCVVDGRGVPTDELAALARRELRDLMGVEAEPVLSRVRRRAQALPVYAPGHHERVESARIRARALGVELAGNAYDGVGVPDCIASGAKAADAAATRLAA